VSELVFLHIFADNNGLSSSWRDNEAHIPDTLDQRLVGQGIIGLPHGINKGLKDRWPGVVNIIWEKNQLNEAYPS